MATRNMKRRLYLRLNIILDIFGLSICCSLKREQTHYLYASDKAISGTNPWQFITKKKLEIGLGELLISLNDFFSAP